MKQILAISFFALCCFSLSGQDKQFAISAGVGLPELVNLGLRYNFNQGQLAFSLGTAHFGSDKHSSSIAVDIYTHWAGHSKLSERRPGFFKFGLDYHRFESEYERNKYLDLNVCIGREFNVTPRLGLQLHGGFFFNLYDKTERKKQEWDLDVFTDYDALPSIGMAVFYKI